MPTTTINGVRIFWELTGDSGEPLVLIHGSFVDHHNWGAVVPSLARSFRVLAYDRRGYSQSERSRSPASARDHVADVAALIEALGLGPSHVVGHSLGGLIALRLADERPDLCRSLVINEPPLLSVLAGDQDYQADVEAMGAKVASVLQLLEAGNIEDGVRQFVETVVFGPGAWDMIPAEVRQMVLFNAPSFVDEMRDPEFLTIDRARLHSIARPVLLTCGQESPRVFRSIIEELSQALPEAQVITFPGVVHEPEDQQPAEYVAAVTRFLDGVSRRAQALAA